MLCTETYKTKDSARLCMLSPTRQHYVRYTTVNMAHKTQEAWAGPAQTTPTRQCASAACCISQGLLTGVLACMYVVLVVFFVYICAVAYEMLRIPACATSLQLPTHTGCNRDDALCGKRYNDIVQATMHNAFATTQDHMLVAQHRGCMRSALVRGVRTFMLDVHLTSSGDVALCHYSCKMGTVSLSRTLHMFLEFLERNPREIVTVIWEMTPASPKSAAGRALYLQWRQAISASGLVPHMFSREQNRNVWPTLQQMIDDGTRMVSFSNFHSDHAAKIDWDMWQARFIEQTPFDSLTKRHLEANCLVVTVFTPAWTMPWQPLLVMNQFTAAGVIGVNTDKSAAFADFMGMSALQTVNGEQLLWHRVHKCARCLARIPNFVVVDFWDSSDVLQVVRRLNNLSSHERRRILQGNLSACPLPPAK